MECRGAKQQRKKEQSTKNNDNDENPTTTEQPSDRRFGETVEASLNRLSKAYQAFMECMAVLHRPSSSQTENDEFATAAKREEMVSLLIAQTARTLYEKALLYDALILPYLFHILIPQLSHSSATATDSELRTIVPAPPKPLTAARH
jgi:hypothetical protein